MSNVSVCTIYAKRKLHLINLVKGLTNSKVSFNELIVVTMNDKLPDLPTVPFNIKTTAVNTANNFLPLAEARNKAADFATGENLIFLDVDCIPLPSLVETFDHHLKRENAIYQGSVRYLTSGWQKESWTYNTLQQQSSPHKLQQKEANYPKRISQPYELFWSLCFGIRKKTFLNTGGFDSAYEGYGGEDTDFSFMARSHEIPLYKISPKISKKSDLHKYPLAYHQFHHSYNPPLNHLAEIVSNAKIFNHKWNILPMKKWLEQFADMGYIKLNNNKIEIIKYPTKSEIKACLKNY